MVSIEGLLDCNKLDADVPLGGALPAGVPAEKSRDTFQNDGSAVQPAAPVCSTRLEGVALPVATVRSTNKKLPVPDPELEARVRGCIVDDLSNAKLSWNNVFVSWNDVFGSANAKHAIRSVLTGFLEESRETTGHLSCNEGAGHPLRLALTALRPGQTSAGVLLHGPAGTGKTMLLNAAMGEAAKNHATIFKVPFFERIYNSKQFIKKTFEVARKEKPAIIVFDDAHEIFPARTESVDRRASLRQFLSETAGWSCGDVIVLAATDSPNDMDCAALRRFAKVKVAPPDGAMRAALLTHYIEATKWPFTATAAEITALCAPATMNDVAGIDLREAALSVRDAVRRRYREAKFFVERDGEFWPCEAGTPNARKTTYFDLLTGTEKKRVGREPITLEHLKEPFERFCATRAPGALTASGRQIC